jgi:hypothetical protein
MKNGEVILGLESSIISFFSAKNRNEQVLLSSCESILFVPSVADTKLDKKMVCDCGGGINEYCLRILEPTTAKI